MSYHSRLSVKLSEEAASVRNEGPSFLDEVAHRIAELAVLRLRDYSDATLAEHRALTGVYERAMKTLAAMADYGAATPRELLAILRDRVGAEAILDQPDHVKILNLRDLYRVVEAHAADVS